MSFFFQIWRNFKQADVNALSNDLIILVNFGVECHFFKIWCSEFSFSKTMRYLCNLPNLRTFNLNHLIQKLRTHLVRCNGYYTVIGISITKNKRKYNVITITIHLFGDNTWIESWICILYFTTTWLIYEYCL